MQELHSHSDNANDDPLPDHSIQYASTQRVQYPIHSTVQLFDE